MTAQLPQFVRDLLSAPPRAGEGVNSYLFRLARVLHPYRNESEILEALRAIAFDCGRTVPEREIRRAVENSKAVAWTPGEKNPVRSTPPWPSVNVEQREAIIRNHELADLWECSPVRIDSNESCTEEIIDVLFPGDPLLCCGADKAKFATRTREEWRGELSHLALVVPSPMSSKTGLTQEGKESEHALSNTGPRRFLVVEFDQGTVDEHAALLLHLAERAPLAVAVHSGGKSLHGWFYCQSQQEDRLRRFMAYAVSIGADHVTWTRSQFVRMPDGTRDNGNKQAVYFFNPSVIK